MIIKLASLYVQLDCNARLGLAISWPLEDKLLPALSIEALVEPDFLPCAPVVVVVPAFHLLVFDREQVSIHQCHRGFLLRDLVLHHSKWYALILTIALIISLNITI